MEIALIEAAKAAKRGEVPVGAVIVDGLSGDVLARAGNCTEANNDPTAHAEVLVIREAASKLENPRLESCDL
jgi:tRNA(Arg) A34 adenosine deaminase TadA